MIGPHPDEEFETFDEAAMMELDTDINIEPMGIDEVFVEPVSKKMMPAKPMVEKTSVQAPAKFQKQEDIHFSLLLKIFYQRLFPFKDFYKWLSYGSINKHYFLNREFSFTLASDTYIRFKSFNNDTDLKNEIIRLCPVKIDIGAVYNYPPAHKKSSSAGFVPQERELVFDIDMTDYDEIRTCCSGGDICIKCWQFMTLAVKILDRALKEDLGFRHRLWVYSGRRGVHCWISDERARKLSSEARRAIVSYLEIVKGGEHAEKKVLLKPQLHPSIKMAYHILEKNFKQVILKDMDVLGNPETWKKVLQLIPDDDAKRELESEWQDNPSVSSLERWESLVRKLAVKEKEKKKPQLGYTTRDIILQYTYPRLDANVSMGLNHLLKSPFCIHPKTGRVCVPIDPDRCESFDPFSVPTLESLIAELDSSSSMEEDSDNMKDYEKTSLKPHIVYFKTFLSGLSEEIRASLRTKRAEEERKLMF